MCPSTNPGTTSAAPRSRVGTPAGIRVAAGETAAMRPFETAISLIEPSANFALVNSVSIGLKRRLPGGMAWGVHIDTGLLARVLARHPLLSLGARFQHQSKGRSVPPDERML